jgi:hypothetical protein
MLRTTVQACLQIPQLTPVPSTGEDLLLTTADVGFESVSGFRPQGLPQRRWLPTPSPSRWLSKCTLVAVRTN